MVTVSLRPHHKGLVLTEKRKPERRDRAAAPPDWSGERIRGFTRRAVNSLQSHPEVALYGNKAFDFAKIWYNPR